MKRLVFGILLVPSLLLTSFNLHSSQKATKINYDKARRLYLQIYPTFLRKNTYHLKTIIRSLKSAKNRSGYVYANYIALAEKYLNQLTKPQESAPPTSQPTVEEQKEARQLRSALEKSKRLAAEQEEARQLQQALDESTRLTKYQELNLEVEPPHAKPQVDLEEKKEREEVLPQAILAVADAAKIFSLINNQGTLQQHAQRLDEPDIKSIAYHPSGHTLTALKGKSLTNVLHEEDGFKLDAHCALPEKVNSIAYHPSQLFIASSSHNEGDLPRYYIRVYSLLDDNRPLLFEASNREKGIITLSYDPTGNYLAVTNNVKNVVTMLFSNRSAQLNNPQSFPTGGKGSLRTAFSPKGRVLSTINALSDNISVFVYGCDGALFDHGIYSSGGTHPIDLDYDPSGDYLAVAHDTSKDIVILTHDKRKQLRPISCYSLDMPLTALAFKPLSIIPKKKHIKGDDNEP